MITKTSLAAPSLRFKFMEAMLEAQAWARRTECFGHAKFNGFNLMFVSPKYSDRCGFHVWHTDRRGKRREVTKTIFKALREFGGDDYRQFCLENFSPK